MDLSPLLILFSLLSPLFVDGGVSLAIIQRCLCTLRVHKDGLPLLNLRCILLLVIEQTIQHNLVLTTSLPISFVPLPIRSNGGRTGFGMDHYARPPKSWLT